MSTLQRNDAAVSTPTKCEFCGTEGVPLQPDPEYGHDPACAECIARRRTFTSAWRASALASVGGAIDFALKNGDCTLEQVREACDYYLDPANRVLGRLGRDIDSVDAAMQIAGV